VISPVFECASLKKFKDCHRSHPLRARDKLLATGLQPSIVERVTAAAQAKHAEQVS
jgi:hypothetical protein